MKAFELLSDRSKWTQGAYARTASGLVCDDDVASQWCGVGAIYHCYPGEGLWPANLAHDKSRELFGETLTVVNDRLGYEAVMQVLREANV